MKRLGLRIVMLFSLTWVLCANFHMLGTAVEVINETNNEIGVKIEMQQYCQCIQLEYVSTDELPQNPWDTVRSCLAADGRKPPPDLGRDKWGNQYKIVIQTQKHGIMMISRGPDGRLKTDDDIVFFQHLPGGNLRPPH